MAFASAGDAACLGGPDVEQTASHADKVRTAKVVAFVSAGDAAGGDVDQTASHADKVRTAKVANRNSQPGGQGDNRKSHGRRLNSQPGGQGENRKSLGGRRKTVSPAAKTRTATRIKKMGSPARQSLAQFSPVKRSTSARSGFSAEGYSRKLWSLLGPGACNFAQHGCVTFCTRDFAVHVWVNSTCGDTHTDTQNVDPSKRNFQVVHQVNIGWRLPLQAMLLGWSGPDVDQIASHADKVRTAKVVESKQPARRARR